MKKDPSAIIKTSSGKSVEVQQFGGVFSCLLEHEVKTTKATFAYNGPKLRPQTWAQVMEFFEWTQATERSEAQVRLYVHPEQGWAAWAFPQEGGTGMTSKELPMDSKESAEQRQQFKAEEGWLYWGTVHHHCTASAFQSGTDEANESSQEGLHITVGHMDKAMRDLHCRMYIKGHKFEPMMHHFFELDEALMDKAQEMYTIFNIYPDMNDVARKVMSQCSEALYHSCLPTWVPVAGENLFPPQWKLNYQVKRWQPAVHVSASTHGVTASAYRLGGPDWCVKCQAWGHHTTDACTFIDKRGELGGGLTKKQRRKIKYLTSQQLVKVDDKKSKKAEILLDILEGQAAVMGFDEKDYYNMIEALASGNNGALCEIVVEALTKEKLTPEDLYCVILEREIKAEMQEKTAVEEQQLQINGAAQLPWDGQEYSGFGG